MKLLAISMVASAIVLSGCGGGGGTGTTTTPAISPATVTKNNLTNATATSATATSATVSGLSGGTDTYARVGSLDHGSFRAYAHAEGGELYVLYLAKDADVEAAVGGEVNNVGLGRRGSLYRRTTALTLPTSGTATYTGNYVGIVQTTLINDTLAITGAANLNANFATNRIDGSITNRRLGTEAYKDVRLNATNIGSTGRYAGTATERAGTASGSYEGILGGANARQTAGVVELDFPIIGIGGGTGRETGAFVATR